MYNMTENEHLLFNIDSNNTLSESCRTALSQLEEYLNNNTSDVCCRKLNLISHVRNATITEQWSYIAYLCTLVEQRWCTPRSLPYNGNKTCPNNPIRDIWRDYEFDSPTKTVLDVPALSISRDLDETRQQKECSKCQSDEQIQCPHCQGHRSVLIWTQLNVRWSNNSSTIVFSPNNQNFCPEEIIQTASNKKKCLEVDTIWSSTTKTLDDILDQCNDLPEGFRNEVNNKFRLNQKGEKILRLKCIIESLRIERIDYRLNGLQDELFTFYRVGEERRLYVTESSYPIHTQKFKTGCSCM